MKVVRTRSDIVIKAVIVGIDLVASQARYHNETNNPFLRPTTGYNKFSLAQDKDKNSSTLAVEWKGKGQHRTTTW